jgi:hypothetical protein
LFAVPKNKKYATQFLRPNKYTQLI